MTKQKADELITNILWAWFAIWLLTQYIRVLFL